MVTKERTQWWDDVTKVRCLLCNKYFRRITNTHLWNAHQTTMEEYIKTFPDSKIDAEGLADSRVDHLRDRTYEEIYGEGKSSKLIETRRQSTSEQMKDPLQIEIRKEKCGYEMTEETKLLLSKSKTVHGGSNYRERALKHYGLECQRCGKDGEDPGEFIVHHKDFANISSELGNHEIDNLMVLCKPCHSKLHNEMSGVSGKFIGLSDIEKGVHHILMGLKKEYGLDLKDANFKDTPKRVARAYAEIFSGIKNTKEQVKDILSTAFPSECNGLIIAKDVRVFSMCPHHLLPVDYTISVAYIPSPDGRVLGISKLSRLVEVLAGRPVLQEQLGEDITNSLMGLDGCVGAGCLIEGKHYCMIMRGVNQTNCVTGSSSMKGVFLQRDSEGVAARAELMSLWSSKRST